MQLFSSNMNDEDPDVYMPRVSQLNLTPAELERKLDLNNCLNVSHLNVRSLNANYEEVKLLFEQCFKSKFHVIGISETWKIENASLYYLNNYNFEYQCRTEGRGGGVGAYICAAIPYTRINICISNAESLFLKLKYDNKTIIVGVIYRKPDGRIEDFENELNNSLHELKLDKYQCVIIGDFNINLISPNEKDSEFLTMMECYGLQQIVSSPTRITSASSTLIDHIYPNMSCNASLT